MAFISKPFWYFLGFLQWRDFSIALSLSNLEDGEAMKRESQLSLIKN
jgi:hypothetical protein